MRQVNGINYAQKLSDLAERLCSYPDLSQHMPTLDILIQNLITNLKNVDLNVKAFNELQTEIRENIAEIRNYHAMLVNHKVPGEIFDHTKELNNFFELISHDLIEPSIKTDENVLKLDQIIHWISKTKSTDPEWMSRLGKILVADSNINTLQVIERRLIREGHNVICAQTPEALITLLDEHTPDTIIVENLLTPKGISNFIGLIQDKYEEEYIPVIVIGPMNDSSLIEEAFEAGASNYLSKPVNPILLHANIRTALEKKSSYNLRQERRKKSESKRANLERAINNLDHGFAIFDQDHVMIMHNDRIRMYYPHLSDYMKARGDTKITFREMLECNIYSGIYAFEPEEESHRSEWLNDKLSKFNSPSSQWEEVLINSKILEISTYRTPDGGGALIVRDITESRTSQKDLSYQAYHDALTGLMNRVSFKHKLVLAMEKHKYPEDGFIAILFLDLDGFKSINDSYGHEMGDWVLVQVANRLRHSVRSEDIVSRFGGDEFCITLSSIRDLEKINMVAERVIKMIKEPFVNDNLLLNVGISIGIALFPEDAIDSETLINQADKAMYQAKKKGKGTYYYFKDQEIILD